MKLTNNKSIIQIWCFISIFVFFVESSPGQTCLDVKTDSLIHCGIELAIQHDYAKAESIFQQLIEDYPDHPMGYFFMAATIQSKMMDYESDQWSDKFHHYIQLSIQFAEKNEIGKQTYDPWLLFYHGSALCYLAFYEGRNGDLLKAVRHGLSGISILNRINKIKPEFYDVYFGIGSYKYWRSQKTKFLNWLPLVSDDRDEGVAMVRLAVAKGTYTQFAAMNELIWILVDAGKAVEAYNWALKGLEKFPQSRFFLWGAAKTAFILEDYSASLIHFEKLLDSIINAPFDNYYNEYICRIKLAQCYEKLGRFADVSNQIIYIESLSLSPVIEKKLKKQREEFSQLKKKLPLIAKTNDRLDTLTTKYNLADKQRSQ